MKRPYNKNKTARLPGARITENFRDDLKKASNDLKVSQASILEMSFNNFIVDDDNFRVCPKCGKSTIRKFEKCVHCDYEFVN